MFEIVTQDRDAYKVARQKAKKLLVDKKRDQALASLREDVIPALDKYRAMWGKFIDLQTAAMQQSMKESQEAYAMGRRIALLLLVVTIVLPHSWRSALPRALPFPSSKRSSTPNGLPPAI